MPGTTAQASKPSVADCSPLAVDTSTCRQRQRAAAASGGSTGSNLSAAGSAPHRTRNHQPIDSYEPTLSSRNQAGLDWGRVEQGSLRCAAFAATADATEQRCMPGGRRSALDMHTCSMPVEYRRGACRHCLPPSLCVTTTIMTSPGESRATKGALLQCHHFVQFSCRFARVPREKRGDSGRGFSR